MQKLTHGETKEEVYEVKIDRDVGTGIIVYEKWSLNGKAHRVDGPADIIRDVATGTVVNEHWFFENRSHRDNGAAIILRRADTGRVYFSEWYQHGEKVKPPRPAARPPTGPRARKPEP
jgi:hypothetical protein